MCCFLQQVDFNIIILINLVPCHPYAIRLFKRDRCVNSAQMSLSSPAIIYTFNSLVTGKSLNQVTGEKK